MIFYFSSFAIALSTSITKLENYFCQNIPVGMVTFVVVIAADDDDDDVSVAESSIENELSGRVEAIVRERLEKLDVGGKNDENDNDNDVARDEDAIVARTPYASQFVKFWTTH